MFCHFWGAVEDVGEVVDEHFFDLAEGVRVGLGERGGIGGAVACALAETSEPFGGDFGELCFVGEVLFAVFAEQCGGGGGEINFRPG